MKLAAPANGHERMKYCYRRARSNANEIAIKSSDQTQTHTDTQVHSLELLERGNRKRDRQRRELELELELEQNWPVKRGDIEANRATLFIGNEWDHYLARDRVVPAHDAKLFCRSVTGDFLCIFSCRSLCLYGCGILHCGFALRRQKLNPYPRWID